MPFKSEKQRRYLWKFHPDIAREWTDKYGSKPVNKESMFARAMRRRKKEKKHG